MEELFINLPPRTSRKGQILLFEGDMVNRIYFLLKGYVKVYGILPSGQQRTIIIYAPGEVFPLTSLLSDPGIVHYFYECMTNVELKMLSFEDFQRKIKGNLALGEQMIGYTYRQNLESLSRIETLSAHSANLKVASLLLYLADKTGVENQGLTELGLPLTNQEIAEMCGLTRETTSAQLKNLRRQGIVLGERQLNIDRAKLKKLMKPRA